MTVRRAYLAAAGLMIAASGSLAQAEDRRIALPQGDKLGFQEPATEIMTRITHLHDDVMMPIITVITLIVFALLAWVFIKFNRKANPVPSTTTHNTLIEVIWTALPILILVVIAVPSIKLLYFNDVIPKADLTVKATGNQWYWTYEYPDQDGLTFDSVLVKVEDKAATDAAAAEISRMLGRTKPVPMHRLLDTDTRMVVPVNKTVQVLVTASDVLHAWTIPAFGVKVDAVPGRMNSLWFKATEVGTYYGQCSELCGKDHAYMPIAVEVVTEAEYAAWLARAKEAYASLPAKSTVKLASVDAARAN